MGDATGPGKPGSSNAPGDCTPCCRRPPRPRRTARNKRRPKAQRFLMEPRKQAQTLAAIGLRDFRVPFVPDTLSASPGIHVNYLMGATPWTLGGRAG